MLYSLLLIINGKTKCRCSPRNSMSTQYGCLTSLILLRIGIAEERNEKKFPGEIWTCNSKLFSRTLKYSI